MTVLKQNSGEKYQEITVKSPLKNKMSININFSGREFSLFIEVLSWMEALPT